MNDKEVSPRDVYTLPPVESSIREAYGVGYTNPPQLLELVSIYSERRDTRFCATALDSEPNFCVATRGFKLGDSTFTISDYQLFESFVDMLLADNIPQDKWLERVKSAQLKFCVELN